SIINTYTRAKRRGETFFNHPHSTDASMFRSAEKRATFNRRDASQHAHECSPAEMRKAAARLVCENRKHLFRLFKISDYAIHHRSEHCDASRFATLHLLCVNSCR